MLAKCVGYHFFG